MFSMLKKNSSKPLPKLENYIPAGLVDGHAYCYPQREPTQTRNSLHLVGSHLKREGLFEDLLKELRANNIAGALLTQPHVLGLNHHYLLDCLDYAHRTYPEMFFRGVVNLPPLTHIHTMLEMNSHGIIGVRMNLIGKFLPDFHSEEWRSFIDHLHRMQWFLEVQIEGERLPDILDQLLAEVPHLILEHFGLPDLAHGTHSIGLKKLCGLSESQKKNLSVLLSGPYRVFAEYSGDQSAQLAIDIVSIMMSELGGEEYLIWGSDWPFGQLTHTLEYWHALEWGKLWLKEDGRKGMVRLLNRLYYG